MERRMSSPSNLLARRKKFEAVCHAHSLDALVVTDARDVTYLTGHRYMSHQAYPTAAIYAVGAGWLGIGPGKPADLGPDVTSLGYEAALGGTSHPDWMKRMTTEILGSSHFFKSARRLGYQSESAPLFLLEALIKNTSAATLVDVGLELLEAQRVKDDDELAMIRLAIAANQAAYRVVEKTIDVGVTEAQVLAAGARAAIDAAGEWVYHNGDYQAGSAGGPARDKPLVKGQMYVVDAWTIYRNYWADMSRAYCVGGSPSQEQASVFEHVAKTHEKLADMFRPGVDGVEIWRAADAWLRQHPLLKDSGLIHHAGHGTGLRAHAMPDLNATRGGKLIAGEVICFEPGGYVTDKGVFCRLENMYLINETGPATNLCAHGFHLTRG
jgi:Xaa-Pro aminopeptidase